MWESEELSGSDGTLAERGFCVEQELGAGSYSKVKQVVERKSGARFAVKIVDRAKASDMFLQKYLAREIEILRTIRHPNLIRTHETFDGRRETFIVMEVAELGDLEQWINLKGPPKDSGKYSIPRTIFRQALEALRYLHGNGIAHRDIKCDNLLLDRHKNLKLGDFGFAKKSPANQLSLTFCGSLAYTAPEIIRVEEYDPYPTDMWSLGVVLFILLFGVMPFDDSDGPSKLIQQQNNPQTLFDGHFSEKPSREALDLIRWLLSPLPSQRPTPLNAIFSDWMKSTPYFNRPHHHSSTHPSPPRRP